MSSAKVRSRLFRLPKAGSTEAEYEDASAVQGLAAPPFRAAVADGATESAFARAWANRLVNGWIEEALLDAASFEKALAGWQAAWQEEADGRTGDLPWYAAAKAQEGAFAAFLGLCILPGGLWRAVAVGDCCLFHVQTGGTRRTWPMDRPDQFTSTPELVPSRPALLSVVVLEAEGRWARGDAFVLATDAAAAWLMTADDPMELLPDEEAFQNLVATARRSGRLRNDDVTLVTIQLM